MKVIKDTWNGFMARRRLDHLWFELQTKIQQKQQHQAEINQFLGCFLTMIQQQPPIDSIFGHKDQLLELMLQTIHKDYQLRDLQVLLHLIKDLLTHGNDDTKFEQISAVLMDCIAKESDFSKLKQTIKVLAFLFSKVKDLKIKMADLFTGLLQKLETQNQECGQLILSFLQSELAQECDHTENQRLSLLSDPGLNPKQTPLSNLINKVTQKILTEIPIEYQQQLQAERNSDASNPLVSDQLESPFTLASDAAEPLTTEQINSMLSRGDSNVTKLLEDQNSLFLKLLRTGNFMQVLIDKLTSCKSTQLHLFVKVAGYLQCFSKLNWTETERTVLPTLQARFQHQDLQLYQFMLLLTSNGKQDNKISNSNLFQFVLKVTPLQESFYKEFKIYLQANQANPVIFFKEKGFEWLEKLTLTPALVDLVQYILFVLSDLQQDCKQLLITISLRSQNSLQCGLLRNYFHQCKADVDELQKQLFLNCQKLKCKLLFAALLEYQLQVKPKLFEHLDFVSEQDWFLKGQMVKCLLHTGQSVDVNDLSLDQTQLLRMLFIECNNPKADQLKQQLNVKLLFTQFQQEQDQVKQTNLLMNLSIMISGSNICKQQCVFSYWKINAFTSLNQRIIAQCLLDYYCEHTTIDFLWNFVGMSDKEQQLFISQTQQVMTPKNQVKLRHADYSFLILMIAQMTHENQIYCFQFLSRVVTAENKLKLIEAGFEQFLLQMTEYAKQLQKPQYLYYKETAYLLLEKLLEQGVLTNTQLTLNMPEMLTQILSLEPEGESKLKVNTAPQDSILLFTTDQDQISLIMSYEQDTRSYALVMQNKFLYSLDNLIQLGLFEPSGWNKYEITDFGLTVNGVVVFRELIGVITPSEFVIGTQEPKPPRKINQIVLGQGELSIHIFDCEVKYHLTDFITTVVPLKQFLSNQQFLTQLIGIINKAQGEEQILNYIELLVSLVTKNTVDLAFDLESVVTSKMMEMHPTGIYSMMQCLVDLSLDQVGATQRLESEHVPFLVKPSLLALPFQLLAKISSEQGGKFIEMLTTLLKKHSSNIKAFYEQFGIDPILNVFILVQDNQRKLGLYESAIGLFELFVDGAQQNLLPPQMFKTVLDFILRQSSGQMTDQASRNVIDMLSVFMIHVIIDDSNVLIEKLIQFDIVSCFYKLLASKSTNIREFAFKCICCLLSKSKKIDLDYDLICNLLSIQDQSMNLCMIILDCSTSKFTNVNDLTPEDDSLVIQMMNASRSAQKIVDQITFSFNQKRSSVLCTLGMVDCFIAALAKVVNDVSRDMCLKQFLYLLIDQNNLEVLSRKEGFVENLVYSLFKLQIDFITCQESPTSVQLWYDNYLFQKHLQPQGQGYYSTTEDDPLHTSGNKSESRDAEMLPPTRMLDRTLDLVRQIVVRDLHQDLFNSKTYTIMLMHPVNDDRLQLQIVSKILKHFNREPKLNERAVLLNLYRIFANLQKLMSENELVCLKFINLINLIAFKSSTDVRKMMKEFKLLQLRDQYMVSLIRMTYETNTEFFISALSQFSFESIASKPIFQQNCCTYYMVLILDEAQKQAGFETYAANIKHRLQTEILQFDHNKLKGLHEDLARNSISPQLLEHCTTKVNEHLVEIKEQAENFTKERLGRRQILVAEAMQDRLMKQRKQI